MSTHAWLGLAFALLLAAAPTAKGQETDADARDLAGWRQGEPPRLDAARDTPETLVKAWMSARSRIDHLLSLDIQDLRRDEPWQDVKKACGEDLNALLRAEHLELLDTLDARRLAMLGGAGASWTFTVSLEGSGAQVDATRADHRAEHFACRRGDDGWRIESWRIACAHCEGEGVCPRCHGKGVLTNAPCESCRGGGACVFCEGDGRLEPGPCWACQGTGVNGKGEGCLACQGSGQRHFSCPSCAGDPGRCEFCQGRGVLADQPCAACDPQSPVCPQCVGARWVDGLPPAILPWGERLDPLITELVPPRQRLATEEAAFAFIAARHASRDRLSGLLRRTRAALLHLADTLMTATARLPMKSFSQPDPQGLFAHIGEAPRKADDAHVRETILILRPWSDRPAAAEIPSEWLLIGQEAAGTRVVNLGDPCVVCQGLGSCAPCQGVGQVIGDPCWLCEGSGVDPGGDACVVCFGKAAPPRQKCVVCGGTGRCADCRGEGVRWRLKR